MPVLIIGWSVYDNLPEEAQKEFALVERYRTDYFYECYEYEMRRGIKIMSGVIDALTVRESYWTSLVMK